MKKYFKYSPQSNQYYLNYKGMPINIDKDEFDLMSDSDVETYIKRKTLQTPKPEKKEDVLPFDQGLDMFKQGKDRLNFLKYYNSRK